MASPTAPDWGKLTAGLYPHLSAAEQEALRKIWSGNYDKFAPLKAKITASLDPDFRVDPDPASEKGA